MTSQPSKNKIKEFVTKNSTTTLLVTEASVKENHVVCISVDKGNKAGNKNLAKFICWYDRENKKVKTFLIDTDCSDDDTDKIADAITHSIRRLFEDLPEIKVTG